MTFKDYNIFRYEEPRQAEFFCDEVHQKGLGLDKGSF